MARSSNPDNLTRVSINGSTGYAVQTKMPFEDAVPHIVEAATQSWTEGRGKERRTRSRLRIDLMSYELGGFTRGAEEDDAGHYWEPFQRDLLRAVIEQVGELDQDAYQRGYDALDEVYRKPHNPGIGNYHPRA